MKYDPQRHHRRSIRLKGYDYTQPGGYYVTIVTQDRACLFGEVVDGKMVLNTFGRIIDYHWQKLPKHFKHIKLDVYQIMPNHLHGIIIITDHMDTKCAGDTGDTENAGNMVDGRDDDGRDVGGGDVDGRDYGGRDVDGRDYDGHDAGAKHSGQNISNTQDEFFKNALPLYSSKQQSRARPRGTQPGSLGAIMQNFQSITTRKINRIRKTPGKKLWQRNYWENIIRNENALNRIRKYIINNPSQWQSDKKNPYRQA